MKSAYELAMERLEKESPTIQLSAEQKAQIAEIDSVTKAKIAEKELFLRDKISQAMANGDLDAIRQIEHQLGVETRRLQSDGEEKKEKIRSSKG